MLLSVEMRVEKMAAGRKYVMMIDSVSVGVCEDRGRIVTSGCIYQIKDEGVSCVV